MSFLHKHKNNAKIHMNHKEFIMAKNILEKNKTKKKLKASYFLISKQKTEHVGETRNKTMEWKQAN